MSIEDDIYTHFKELYYNKFSFNEKTFLSTMLKAMEFVESYKNLNGLEKKTIVKNLMKKLLLDLEVDENFSTLKNYYLENSTALDSHIDTMISVSRGLYNLNKKSIDSLIKKFLSHFKCCK